MLLSVALLLQSEGSSFTDMDGRTAQLCAAKQKSIVDVGLTEHSLLKVPPLHSRARQPKKKNQVMQGAQTLRPLIFLR